jgi:lipid II:glycine glycyltransferase (peptidoglycan interpeptide bridge formation enzyme)
LVVIREASPSEREAYNQTVSHVMQSWEWGKFREKTGAVARRLGKYVNGKLVQGMQATFHTLPATNLSVGYIPKGSALDKEWLRAWVEAGRQERAVFIKFEPNVIKTDAGREGENLTESAGLNFRTARKPLFTKYNFLVDISLPEEELLARMKAKTRYNIRLAQRKGVVVRERSDEEAFRIYLDLYFETTKRQGFFGHDPVYHRNLWETLRPKGMAHLLIASRSGEPLAAWMLFRFKKTLYYPYGGSSPRHREVMASNLICWEAIKLGKRLGCEVFDLWGAARVPDPKPDDPYYGFHRFKAGYGGQLVEYVGSYDLVLRPFHYEVGHLLDKLRWRWLGLRSRLRQGEFTPKKNVRA